MLVVAAIVAIPVAVAIAVAVAVEMNHALSVMCWLIIPELAVGEVALLWFIGIRLLLKRSTLMTKPHSSFPNGLCNLLFTISVSL